MYQRWILYNLFFKSTSKLFLRAVVDKLRLGSLMPKELRETC